MVRQMQRGPPSISHGLYEAGCPAGSSSRLTWWQTAVLPGPVAAPASAPSLCSPCGLRALGSCWQVRRAQPFCRAVSHACWHARCGRVTQGPSAARASFRSTDGPQGLAALLASRLLGFPAGASLQPPRIGIPAWPSLWAFLPQLRPVAL